MIQSITPSITPTTQAILEFLGGLLCDPADELCKTYDDVVVRLSISAR